MRKNTSPLPEILLDVLLVLFEAPRGSGDLADAVGLLQGRDVPLATFYRRLQRAVGDGWVTFQEPSEDLPAGPGRPERVYRLTEAGETMLRQGMETQRRRVARATAAGLLMEPR